MTDAAPRIDPEELLANAGWVRALARSLVHDADRADDVVQQTMVAAIEHPPRPGVPLRSWLARVARNLSLNARRSETRRSRRESSVPPPRESASPADSASRAETFREVAEAVLALEPIYRDVVVARFFDGLEMTDVAKRLGVPEETARTRLKRALATLRERLDRRHGGDGVAWIAALAPLADGRSAPRAAAVAAGTGALLLGGGLMGAKTMLAAGAVAVAAAGCWIVSVATSDEPRAEDTAAPAAAAPAAPAPPPVATTTPRRRAEPESVAAQKPPVASAAPAAAAPKPIEPVKGHVKTKSGRPVGGATVFAAPVAAPEAAQPGQSVETQVRTYLDTIRSMRPYPAGCAVTATDSDGSYALPVGADDRVWVFAWADGCDMHAAEGASIKDVRAGATVDFVASDRDDLARTVVDPSASEADRIAALGVLRGVSGGITPAVAVSMVELLRTSRDAKVRRDIIRNLHRCGEPSLRTALLDALRDDADDGVRTQAAKDIDDFADDAAVRTALERARDSDSSEKVRSEAAKTLASRRR